MDPISAIGLLASLSSLIKACDSTLNILKDFKDGERDMLELMNDIAIFDGALKGFDRVLRSRQTSHNISSEIIQHALDQGSMTIAELETRLGEVAKHKSSGVRRMKWIYHKSSFEKTHSRLREQNTVLQSFLALTQALVTPSLSEKGVKPLSHTRETYFAVCGQHPQFLEFRSVNRNEVNNGNVSSQDLELDNSSVECGSSWSSLRSSVSTAPSSVNSLRSSLGRVSIDSSLGANFECADLEDVVRQDYGRTGGRSGSSRAVIRRACRYDCYCVCHSGNTTTSSKTVAKLSELKRHCTDPACEGAMFARCGLEDQSMSFRKALSHVLSSKSIKIRYELSNFRMVSEGSEAMRYVKHGNLEKLKACIDTGEATVWDTAPDGWSLLHTAVYNRQLPIVKYLIDMGADIDSSDVGSRKPADLAILKSLPTDSGNVEKQIVEVFSQQDDYVSDFEFTPIHIAVLGLYDPHDLERPSLEQLIEVLDDANNAPAGTDWAKWKSRYRKRSPLYNAVFEYFRASAYGQSKQHKIIHNLLDQKDKKYCWTPLHWASSTGRVDQMRILVDHGANPFLLSNLDANLLHAAAEAKTSKGMIGALDIWRRFPNELDIEQANRWKETPLHMAACRSLDCVQLLLEAGADRNARQEDHQVPLHFAGLSERGEDRRKVVKLLCAGSDKSHINAQDVDGRPPIFDFLDDPVCVETLVMQGADLELLDNTGQSVFHHACILEENETLKVLLRLVGPDSVMVTVKDHDGNTALIQALRHRSFRCALVILERIDVGDMVGQDGWACIHYAAKLGDVAILEAVLKHRSFVKGMKTIDGKTAEVVAMEAGNWCGPVKTLLRENNLVT